MPEALIQEVEKTMLLSQIDRDQLRDRVRNAQPFPFFCIDNFLVPEFAEEIHASFPSFQEAMRIGKSFKAVNESRKVQITDSAQFPAAISQLHQELASPSWLETMSYVMDIPNLLADSSLTGGGIHETGPRGHLDVHVDFNYLEDTALHRRLNILVYFNKNWQAEWGGNIELWDSSVKVCHHSLAPIFNRCVVFATSDISYHGVSAVRCPESTSRKSFAAYYYTREAPPNWTGASHSTIFRARPDERMKGLVAMPMERLKRFAVRAYKSVRRTVAGALRPASRKELEGKTRDGNQTRP